MVCLCFATMSAGSAVSADETKWLSTLTASAERDRSAATDRDASLRRSIVGESGWLADKEWSGGFSSPLSVEGATGAMSLKPAATAYLAPATTGIKPFDWKLGAGAALSFTKLTGASPLVFRLGPVLSAGAELRFRRSMNFKDDPASRLGEIELDTEFRGNERTAVNSVLSAASMAASSAIARADAEYAEAKTAYLRKQAERAEAASGEGQASRASFAETRDSWERARLEMENSEYLAETYGREAWAVSGDEPPEIGAAFSAERLYALGEMVAALCAGSNPASTAGDAAAAPWDIRIAELAVKELAEAPRLNAYLRLEFLPNVANPAFAPSAEGALDFVIPLDYFDTDNDRKVKRLSSERRDVAAAAAAAAASRFAEAERGLAAGNQRIAAIDKLIGERAARAEAWALAATTGAADALDILAAETGLAEARAMAAREKAEYFLSSIAAFASSGLPLSNLARTAAEQAKLAEKAAASAKTGTEAQTTDKSGASANASVAPKEAEAASKPAENTAAP